MYALPRFNYLQRSRTFNNNKPWLQQTTRATSHYDRVTQELRDLGVSRIMLIRMESRYLPQIIHPDEHLGGVIYGHHNDGYVMLVATDRRLIFLDRKPLFVNKDEITYSAISGVDFSHAGLGSTVTVHSRVKEYVIRTYNQKCAMAFVAFIEARCLEHKEEMRL